MARLTLAPLSPTQDWQKNLYRALERDFDLEPGEMDEYTRVLATSQTVVEAISAGGAHRYIMFESSLPKRLSETIGVLVSGKNRCQFCADAHTRSLEVDRDSAERPEWTSKFVSHVTRNEIEQLPDYTAKERELLKFVDRASRDPGRLTEQDLEQLHDRGFSRRELLDAMAAVALFEMHNRIVIALDLTMPEPYRRFDFPSSGEPLPLPDSEARSSRYEWFEQNGVGDGPEVEELFDFVRREFDVPDPDPYHRVSSISPSYTRALYHSHQKLRDRSALTPPLFEWMGVVAGDVLRCPYVSKLHEQGLRVIDADRADRLLPRPAEDLGRMNEKERALTEFTRKILRRPGSLGDGSFDELRSLGFSDPQVLEVAATAGIFAMDASMIASLGLSSPFA